MKTQNQKSAKELTKNEKEVLVALVQNGEVNGENGLEFLIDEVAAALNKSEKSVAATIGNLQKKGLVDCYGKDYYFSGRVKEEGIQELKSWAEPAKTLTKKEKLEQNLKTAKEFQDAIKDCKSEAAKEYQKQAQDTIEHYEKELAKETKPINKITRSKHQIGDTKFYLGITYYVAGFNVNGVPLWRVKKDGERTDKKETKAASQPKPKKAGVDWSYYDDPKFEKINKKYLAAMGEGDNMATQIVAAVNKLIYKWYNDGDVFDNTHGMEGWANDLSSYANWLAANAAGCKVILDQIVDCFSNDYYERILKELNDLTMREKYLKEYEKQPKVGSVYDCDGDYEFREESDYDDDEF